MAQGFFGSFDTAKRKLRQQAPAQYPVFVYKTDAGPDLVGQCNLVNERFVIKLNSLLDETSLVLMLLHEWSHALSWFCRNGNNHSLAWARSYVKCYRIVGDWEDEK